MRAVGMKAAGMRAVGMLAVGMAVWMRAVKTRAVLGMTSPLEQSQCAESISEYYIRGYHWNPRDPLSSRAHGPPWRQPSRPIALRCASARSCAVTSLDLRG
eukprot:scaffold93985_cov57-Phaeocystis_antarctica.AAC.1